MLSFLKLTNLNQCAIRMDILWVIWGLLYIRKMFNRKKKWFKCESKEKAQNDNTKWSKIYLFINKKKSKPRMQSSSEDKLQLNVRNEIKKNFFNWKKRTGQCFVYSVDSFDKMKFLKATNLQINQVQVKR